MTLAHWLERTAHAHPTLPAIALGPRQTATYAQFAQRAAALAGALRKAGCKSGDPVVLYADRAPEFFEAVYACWWGGYVAAPIEAGYSGAQFRQVCEDLGARVCFVDDRLAVRAMEHAPAGLARFVVLGGSDYQTKLAHKPAPLTKYNMNAAAWLHFGAAPAEGEPLRAATLTHRSLSQMATNLMAELDWVAPRYAQIHGEALALETGLLSIPMVARGGVNVTPESGCFDIAELFDIAERWRRASLYVTSARLRDMARSGIDVDNTAFRSITFGGAWAATADIEQALDRFGPRLSMVYGVKEMPLCLTRLSRHDIAERANPTWSPRVRTIGRGFLSNEIEVRGPRDVVLGPGRCGEIWARGACRMREYWRDKKATDEVVKGGWLKTGLYGARDAGGWIILRNSPADTWTRGDGVAVHPFDAEGELRRSPELDDVVCLSARRTRSGVRDPFDVGGPQFDLAYAGDLDETDSLELCRRLEPEIGRVGDAMRLDRIPRNAEGRPDLTDLAERFRRAAEEDERAHLRG